MKHTVMRLALVVLGLVLIGLLVDLLQERTALQPKAHHAQDGF